MRPLVIGDLCGDLLIPYGYTKKNLAGLSKGSGDHIPQVVFRHGGTCANTASILAKLGDHPLFVTDACSDSNGIWLKEQLEAEGVDFTYCPVSEGTTMLCIAVMDENNEALIFPWLPPGSRYPTFSDKSFNEQLYHQQCLVFIGGMVMQNDAASMNAVCAFAEKMKAGGSVIAFDLNTRAETYGMSEERKKAYLRMLHTSDLVFGSGYKEFAPFVKSDTLQDAAEELAAAVPAVIARNGSDPVYVVHQGTCTAVPVESVHPVNTVGAGDAFNGAYLHAFLNGKDPVSCTEYACRIAAWVITHKEHLSVPEDHSL